MSRLAPGAGPAGIGTSGRDERRNVEKLTDEQLAVLPERGAKAGKWANAVLDWRANGHPDCDDCQKVHQSLWENDANRITYLCHELARALTPLPCGHPPGCVVSVPYMGEEAYSNHCGWCAASEDLAGSIEFNRDVAAENLALEDERDALREKLKAAHALSNALNTMIYLREGGDRLSEVTSKQWEDALRQSKIAIGTWGSEGQSDALREKLKAAEGLAEAFKQIEECDLELGLGCALCGVKTGDGHMDDCELGQALAAWKAAND